MNELVIPQVPPHHSANLHLVYLRSLRASTQMVYDDELIRARTYVFLLRSQGNVPHLSPIYVFPYSIQSRPFASFCPFVAI